MKRLLSVLCAFAVVFGTLILPYAVNADSAVSLTPSELHRVDSAESSGETVYTAGTWDAGSVTFDYKIEAGYTYYLSFDYKGKNTADGQAPAASTVATANTTLNDAVAGSVKLTLPNKTDAFSVAWCELSGDALLASGGQYLALNWVHLTENSYFKNFKIIKMAANANMPRVKYMHRVSASYEDGSVVYTGGEWNAGSIIFDYKIQAGYTYYLSFDFKGHNYAAGQLPSASTVGSTVTHLNDPVSGCVPLGVPGSSQTKWSKVSVELNAEKLLATGGEYLAINWVNLGDTPYFKNFNIEKIKTADDGYIHPVTLKTGEVSKSVSEGEIIYTFKSWACPSMVFDYELEAGKEYEIAFEYKGHSWAQDLSPAFMAAKSTDYKYTGEKLTNYVNMGVSSNRSEFVKYKVIVSANDLIASGGKYLAVVAANLGETGYFKNFTVKESEKTELVGEVPLKVSATKGGGEVTSSNEDGETVYTFPKDWCTPSITFDFRMEAGKTYAVNFDYILTCGFAGATFLEPSFSAAETATEVATAVRTNSVSAGLTKASTWTNKTVIITADDIITATQKYLMFYCVNPTAKNGVKVKNFTIAEIDPNELLSNGNFENALAFWRNSDATATLSTDAAEGKNSVNLKGGAYSMLTHTVALESNKNYKLSFKYKGKFSGLPNWAVTRNVASLEAEYLIHYGTLSDTDTWKTHSVVFSTGSDNIFAVIFQTGAGCDFLIDNVVIVETNEKATESVEGKSPSYTSTEASNRFWHYDAESEDVNLVKNGSFDGEGGNWSSLLGNGTISLYMGDGAYSGDKCLKFEAHNLSEDSKNYLYVSCEPNTEYILSVWHKGENWSDTNKNDMRWGIADPITGKMLFTYRTVTRGYNLNSWDNEWHRTTLKFNSGNNSIIALAYIGANSTAYIDNLQIFKYSDRVNGRPKVMTQEQPDITEYAVEKNYCDTADNLFENSGFEASDISFWSGEDSLGFRGTVSKNYVTLLDWDGTVDIADTSSSHGKALYYTANDQYTGSPLSTSYLKYVDIEPNTEYIFSADFRIDKAGNGRFGLVSVNDFYPRIIGEWKTINADSFDSDYKWQTYCFAFNSNEYERVAFCLQDKGGTVYIDNLRLFKASAAKASTEVNTEIKSSKYTITDGYISVSEGTTVADVLNSLNEKSNIRVFDKNGKEITDKKTLAATGVIFKAMDGISAVDTVTAVLKGDLNGDGKKNSADMTLMLDVLLGKETLEGAYAKAADYSGDGQITLTDAALLSGKAAAEVGSNSKSSLVGPESVNADTEFEVTYYIDGKNISAASGTVKFDAKSLEFVSLTPEIAKGWQVNYNAADGSIEFTAADMSGANSINGKTALFTVTFKAGSVSDIAAALSVTAQRVSAGKDTVALSDIGYSVPEKDRTSDKPSSSPSDNGTYESGNGVTVTEENGLSNNNRLASLIVKNAEITTEFDPENKQYEATVPYETDKLEVEAYAADENATVEITNTELPYVGKNITKITVHSESGLKRTYKIYTTRLAPEEASGNQGSLNNSGMPIWGWILIALGALAVIAAIIIVVIIIKRRKGDK